MGKYIITFTDPDVNAFPLQSFEERKGRRQDAVFTLEFYDSDVSQKFIQQLAIVLETQLNCEVISIVHKTMISEQVPIIRLS